ncbi:MAG: CoB--CoM heterodisulfide reductase iron-sulfur subunit A family protein [Bacteroidales bacterium]|nr:CoB--CoM heterodisulfide reductase iron-sulfur subunit A family protein [Bacteroidales bacterium]
MAKSIVLVIGGGIAGMEAAKQLLRLGIEPVIVEKSDHLGGHVAQWHKLFPDMMPASDLVEKMAAGIDGVTVYLNTQVANMNRLKDGFSVVLSNGVAVPCSAVLIAAGFRLFDASKKEEYGYGIYDHVITNSDLESWFNGAQDSRIPDNPANVAFVHCVGSRDLKAGNPQCSKVCCMTAIKQAIEMKEKFPGAEIWCFYMDLRLFGKKYEDFYINAQQEYGVHFVRGRVSEVGEDINGKVILKAEDTLAGRQVKLRADLLVLMSGMLCNEDTRPLASMVRADVDSDGFLRSRDNIYRICESNKPGIFFAGACTGTKTVPETLAEARAASLDIYNYLRGND